MIFRNYQESDAEEILKWINGEREFRLWSADRYDKYPVVSDDINNNYMNANNNKNINYNDRINYDIPNINSLYR